jgi:hypothetical protein
MPSAQDQSEEVTVYPGGHVVIKKRIDPSVRIPDVVLKCVGFIGEVAHEDATGEHLDLCATGFFVSVPSIIRGLKHVYFVTAKHVARDLNPETTRIVVNKHGGGVLQFRPASPWALHPTDETADVAIAAVAKTPSADIIAITIEDFTTAKDFESKALAIGDEVFSTGLFTEAPGQSRNLPIVRHGHLAMLPDEQIQTELGYADVHLVEVHSIGGMSGSPVWIRPTLIATGMRKDGSAVPSSSVGPGQFLGLMHGHWDIRESEMNKASIIQDRKRGVNLGIGIVVPAAKIFETINQPALVESRDEMDKKMSKRSVPGMDSAKPKAAVHAEEKPFTKEDFETALKKVARKIK